MTTTVSSSPDAPHIVHRGLNLQITFNLSPDLALACEDQARCMGIGLAAWFEQAANEAIRNYLGI
jgi:hypothetical protein